MAENPVEIIGSGFKQIVDSEALFHKATLEKARKLFLAGHVVDVTEEKPPDDSPNGSTIIARCLPQHQGNLEYDMQIKVSIQFVIESI